MTHRTCTGDSEPVFFESASRSIVSRYGATRLHVSWHAETTSRIVSSSAAAELGESREAAHDSRLLGHAPVLPRPQHRGAALDRRPSRVTVAEPAELAHQRLSLILEKREERLTLICAEARGLEIGLGLIINT
jgi:hypothetical protein